VESSVATGFSVVTGFSVATGCYGSATFGTIDGRGTLTGGWSLGAAAGGAGLAAGAGAGAAFSA
jgi:hypothetical protein